MSLANPLLCDLPQKSRARWRLWNVDSVEDGDFPSHLLKKKKKNTADLKFYVRLKVVKVASLPLSPPPQLSEMSKLNMKFRLALTASKVGAFFFFFPKSIRSERGFKKKRKKKPLTAKSMGLNLSPSENHPNKITLSLKICHKLNWGTTTRACVFVKHRRCFMFPNL